MNVFLLLVLFQVKHFVADYILQGWPWADFMLGKFRREQWVLPLASHCGVHMVLTLFLVALAGRGDLWWLMLVDGGVHFVMDRVKAHPDLMGRWKPFGSAVEYHQAYVAATGQQLMRGLREDGYRKMWNNQLFWWSLGFDQAVHHLTDLFVVWRIMQ
jgi:hypothetical protein